MERYFCKILCWEILEKVICVRQIVKIQDKVVDKHCNRS